MPTFRSTFLLASMQIFFEPKRVSIAVDLGTKREGRTRPDPAQMKHCLRLDGILFQTTSPVKNFLRLLSEQSKVPLKI